MVEEYTGDTGGSRISGKGVHMYDGVGGCFADLISFFLKLHSL